MHWIEDSDCAIRWPIESQTRSSKRRTRTIQVVLIETLLTLALQIWYDSVPTWPRR